MNKKYLISSKLVNIRFLLTVYYDCYFFVLNMSKIYDKYLELKSIDKDKLYLFRSGKFYIFIADDADTINEYVVLKKVKFTNDVYKCGFPSNVLDDYLRVFNNHHLNIEIIEDFDVNKDNLVNNIIRSIDIDNITPIEALYKLKELKEIVNEKC